MATIEKKIKKARPSLAKVSPLVHKLCIGFAVINLFVGWILFQIPSEVETLLPLFGNVINFHEWAYAFWILAAAMIYGIASNNWQFLKITLMIGLTTKVFWALSLAVLLAKGHDVGETLLLWLFLAWTQAWTIVHFLPVIGWNGIDSGGDGSKAQRNKGSRR